MPDKFFDQKQPAAVLKHELLKRYLHMYVNKTRGKSKDGQVTYLDGYAGPGFYDDGTEGSPAVAMQTAAIVRGDAEDDRVAGIFIEQDRDSAAELQGYLEEEGLDWPVYQGSVEDQLPHVLDTIDPATSLFVLLDPFGLGIPMDLLARILQRSKPLQGGWRTDGAPTEVLLNFSLPGLRRNAGHLNSPSTNARYLRARATILGRLDATLGGPWWRDEWGEGDEGAVQRVLDGYLERLTRLPGRWTWYTAPVSARWDGPPRYVLLLLTQHPDGVWLFNEAVSNALEEFRRECFEQAGQMDLEPKEQRWEAWVSQIQENIQKELTKGQAFTPGGRVSAVYGNTLGFARERHVRKAIKNLHKAGGTRTTGVGPKVQHILVELPPK